jgi:hypothetical protein
MGEQKVGRMSARSDSQSLTVYIDFSFLLLTLTSASKHGDSIRGSKSDCFLPVKNKVGAWRRSGVKDMLRL